MAAPTNSNALSINFLLSSDAENAVNGHPTQHANGCQNAAKLRVRCVHVPTELPLLPATVGGWGAALGQIEKKKISPAANIEKFDGN